MRDVWIDILDLDGQLEVIESPPYLGKGSIHKV